MKNSLYLLLFASLFLIQCKTENSNALTNLESTLASEPSQANASNVIKEINRLISENKDDRGGNKELMLKGLKIAKEHKINSRAASFNTMLLRGYGNELTNKKEMILDLAGLMIANNREKAADVLYKAYVDLYPEDEQAQAQKSKIEAKVGEDINAYMITLAESIFIDPDQFGMNRLNSSEYVNACEAYALSYADEKSPEYLYKAAEIARSLRTFPKTLSLYDWIIESYPNYEKASTTLFLKGFVIENELQNDELARECYQEFLDKYPNDELADDVLFLLENLGKSNEEILKIIEEGQKAPIKEQ